MTIKPLGYAWGFSIVMKLVATLLFGILSSAAATATPLPGVGAELHVGASTYCGKSESWFSVVLPEARRVLSTVDGFRLVRVVANQGAELDLWRGLYAINCDGRRGYEAYLHYTRNRIASRHGVDTSQVTSMETGVDVAHSMATTTLSSDGLTVTVIATAGTDHNALRAGVDSGAFVEVARPPGTINLVILSSHALTEGAMARAIITATEAKTAALQDLDVRSTTTPAVQATGTGTDQIVVVSGNSLPALANTGGHAKLGELIGKAVASSVKTGLLSWRRGLDWKNK